PLHEIDLLDPAMVLARECRETRDQTSRLIGGDEGGEQLSLKGGLLLHLARHGIGIGADHHELVVEIVNRTIPQALDRLQLPGMAKDLLSRKGFRRLWHGCARPRPGKGEARSLRRRNSTVLRPNRPLLRSFLFGKVQY